MAKITKKAQKTFGGNLTAPNNIAQFGSLKSGSPAYSLDPDTIQALSAYENGWAAAVVNNNAPALQDVNALDFLFSRQLAYLMQTGVPEWDAATTYYIGSVAQDGFGRYYMSIADTNLNNAVTDATKWVAQNLSYVGTDPLVGGATPFQMVYTDHKVQILNPAGAITVKLPTTGVKAGEKWTIVNRAGKIISVQASGGDAVQKINDDTATFISLQNTPTAAAHWHAINECRIKVVDFSSVSYTGHGTVTSTSQTASRRGEFLLVKGAYKSGTETGATFSINLPTGLTIDFAKLPSTFTVGVGVLDTLGSSQTFYSQARRYVVFSDLSDTGKLFVASNGNSDTHVKLAGNGFITANWAVSYSFEIPIAEWALT